MDTLDLANATVAEHERLVRQLLLERQACTASIDPTSVAPGSAGARGWVPRLRRSTDHR